MNCKVLALILAAVLLGTACTAEARELGRAVEPVQVENTMVVRETVVVAETVEVPVTRIVTATPTQTPAPTLAPEQASEAGIAANYVASLEQGGIEVELVRVLCEDIESFRELQQPSDSDQLEVFATSKTACELVLRMTNNTDKLISIYPSQGQVIVNGEQVEPYTFENQLGPPLEDVDGDIHAGVTRIGGFWFGLGRSTWDEVKSMRYIVGAPFDEDWKHLGDDFEFNVDMSDWGFEPFPEEVLE